METRHSHLIELLGSGEPQVIIVDRTYDFIGPKERPKAPFANHGDLSKMDARPSLIPAQGVVDLNHSPMNGIRPESRECMCS